MAVLFAYPSWFIGLCLLFALGLSLLLYFRNKSQQYALWLTWLVGSLRFLTLFILAVLLLGPMVKTTQNRTEKPLVIVGIDNSQSMIQHLDSTILRKGLSEGLAKFEDALGSSYDIAYYTFGSEVASGSKLSFDKPQTDISGFIDFCSQQYYNRNMGAMVLVTDGLYNQGANPTYLSKGSSLPIFPIVVGDTSVQRDLILQKVNYNRISFLGSKFPLEITVKANQCKGQNARIAVVHDGKTTFASNFGVVNDNQVFTFTTELESKALGLNKYTVVVEKVSNEVTTINNKLDIFVDVKDTRQKVLLVANAPHPDIAAIRAELEHNTLYDFTFVLASNYKPVEQNYNLIILHQLPSTGFQMSTLLDNAKKRHTPILFILGQKTNLGMFNDFDAGVNLQSQGDLRVNAFPAINQQFGLFTVSEDLNKYINQLPPFVTPLAKYSTTKVSDVLFYQNIAGLQTGYPLVAFTRNGADNYGIVVGEGLWWLKFKLFALSGSHDLFSELIRKTIQYLSVNEEMGNLRVKAKQAYNENEIIELNAELYNPSFELINSSDVRFTLVNEKGVSYPYAFSKDAKSYKLQLGKLQAGAYQWTAQTSLNGVNISASGSFSVNALTIESLQTQADDQLLFGMASKSGGKLFYYPQLDSLAEAIKQGNTIKPKIYTEKRLHDLVSQWWMLLLLVLLPGLEWGLRKWGGKL